MQRLCYLLPDIQEEPTTGVEFILIQIFAVTVSQTYHESALINNFGESKRQTIIALVE